jgi:hypothetical protein
MACGAPATRPPIATPTLTQGAVTVNGRLPPEVVQRVVRQSFGRFKLCYENRLRNDPTLTGTVTMRFVIDAHGSVNGAPNVASTIGDASVGSCIARALSNMSFPAPDSGTVVVVFPITFTPST